MKKRKKFLHHALIANISFLSEPEAIYEFYHQRQTIENFFKEAKNPFNAGKMPSMLFRGNEAYLYLVTIAYNCFHILKNICQQDSEESLLRHLKIASSPMEHSYLQKMTNSGLLERIRAFSISMEAMEMLTNKYKKDGLLPHYLKILTVRHIN